MKITQYTIITWNVPVKVISDWFKVLVNNHLENFCLEKVKYLVKYLLISVSETTFHLKATISIFKPVRLLFLFLRNFLERPFFNYYCTKNCNYMCGVSRGTLFSYNVLFMFFLGPSVCCCSPDSFVHTVEVYSTVEFLTRIESADGAVSILSTVLEVLSKAQILSIVDITSTLDISPEVYVTNIVDVGPVDDIINTSLYINPQVCLTFLNSEPNLIALLVSDFIINVTVSMQEIIPDIEILSISGGLIISMKKAVKTQFQFLYKWRNFKNLFEIFSNLKKHICGTENIFSYLERTLYTFLLGPKFSSINGPFQLIQTMSPMFLLFVVTKRAKKKPVPTFVDELFSFYHIWPLHQWVFSLVGLILLYWGIGILYNWYLTSYGGWLSNKARIYMILLDIMLNMVVGFYFMHYRDTFMGALTLQCPVAISPFIFWAEFVIVIIYYQWHQYKATKTPPKNNTLQKNESGLTVTGASVMAEDPMSPQMRAALRKRHRGPMGTFLPSTEPSKRFAKLKNRLLDIVYFLHYLFKKFLKRK